MSVGNGKGIGVSHRFRKDGRAWRKFETPEVRQELFKALCDHFRDGRPLRTFTGCSVHTVYSLLEKYPDEFDMDELERAEQAGRRWFEDQYRDAMLGENPDAAPSMMIFAAKNYLGWTDKVETATEVKVVSELSDDELDNEIAKAMAELGNADERSDEG